MWLYAATVVNIDQKSDIKLWKGKSILRRIESSLVVHAHCEFLKNHNAG